MMALRAALRLVILGSLVHVPTAAAAEPAAAPPPNIPAATVAEPELRQQLLDRVAKDQEARQAIIEWMRAQREPVQKQDAKPDDPRLARMRQIDQENTTWMKQLVAREGWPVQSRVGRDGAHAAWLLLQHADHDPAFQKQCLQLMQQAQPGEVSRADVAYLTDRVMLKEEGQQLYGTQVAFQSGTWAPQPLKQPERLDQLRREAGLMPMDEYLQLVRKMYQGPQPPH